MVCIEEHEAPGNPMAIPDIEVFRSNIVTIKKTQTSHVDLVLLSLCY